MKQCASLAKLMPALEHTGIAALKQQKGEVACVPDGKVHGDEMLGHALKPQLQQPKQQPVNRKRETPAGSAACREPSKQGQGQVRL